MKGSWLKRWCAFLCAVLLAAAVLPALAEETAEKPKKIIALTFDDGPNQTTSLQVLEVLQQYEVKATFFLIGQNITFQTKSVVLKEYEAGMEIACHSETHSYMNQMTAEQIRADIEKCVNKIIGITGEAPQFFRPPYIAVNDLMFQNIELPFISGSGCNDWDSSVTAEQRIDAVLSQARDGQIILLHDAAGNTATVEALKVIIPTLLEDGYELVTVSELFARKGITPAGYKVYSNAMQTGMY